MTQSNRAIVHLKMPGSKTKELAVRVAQLESELAAARAPLPPQKPGPKPRGGTTSRPLTIRVTEDERAAWTELAGDLSLSDWIRDTCNAKRDQ